MSSWVSAQMSPLLLRTYSCRCDSLGTNTPSSGEGGGEGERGRGGGGGEGERGRGGGERGERGIRERGRGGGGGGEGYLHVYPIGDSTCTSATSKHYMYM